MRWFTVYAREGLGSNGEVCKWQYISGCKFNAQIAEINFVVKFVPIPRV
jgi:hypothetical protein